MHFSWRLHGRTVLTTAAVCILAAIAWIAFRPPALQREVNRVQKEVAAIRGVDFTQPVTVERMSRERFREYIIAEFRRAPMAEHYWQVVEKLGFYRGPDLGPPELVMADMMEMAGGVYDAERKKFLLLMDLDRAEREMVFAHELYHAWQDREFDLERYVGVMSRQLESNSDEVMARTSVVEGEATYIDTLFQVKSMGVRDPTREQMQEFVAQRGDFDPEQWQAMLADPSLPHDARELAQRMVDAQARVPAFLIELALSPYTNGVTFIHAVLEEGWDEVVALYLSNPPVSTEQILHPEKWFANEKPANIRWPPFDSDPLFADWRLLLENTMGELQWRIVLRQQGLAARANDIAAGWNGDRYAVFKSKSSEDAWLVLFFTTWDTERDAEEFEKAYFSVIANKYPDRPPTWRIHRQGRDVRIVEGGAEQTIDALMAFNSRRP
jgi:hypothetical protein